MKTFTKRSLSHPTVTKVVLYRMKVVFVVVEKDGLLAQPRVKVNERASELPYTINFYFFGKKSTMLHKTPFLWHDAVTTTTQAQRHRMTTSSPSPMMRIAMTSVRKRLMPNFFRSIPKSFEVIFE